MSLKMVLNIIIAAWLCMASSIIYADELRPAYIELNQKSETDWDIVWKASVQSPLAGGAVILPENCKTKGDQKTELDQDNQVIKFTIACKGTISGHSIGLRGLEFSNSDAIVRIAALKHDIQTIRLTPNASITIIPPFDSDNLITNVAGAYTLLGFEHILEGYDHLLFVLALVLLIPNLRRVAITVTAFTIAHSITLMGTTLGYISLSPQPVEAVIALSIIFLALEIIQSLHAIHSSENPKHSSKNLRLSQRYPWIIAFLFGLLHGFGFAGALAEIGLPHDDVPLALLTFNIGVELGQLLIVIAAIAVLRLISHYRPKWLITLKWVLAYAIGIIATYWFIERMIG